MNKVWNVIKVIGRILGTTGRATIALVGICGVVAAVANYTLTQGSGTTFGSIVVSTVHYAQQMICDVATPAQCTSVKPASTLAASTDTSLVVQENPNSALITAINASIPAGTNLIGTVTADPCATKVKLNAAIATSSGNVQLVAPSGSTKVYICSLFVVGATAFVGNIIEGTGAACTTANEAAVIGSTTAASGVSLGANAGWTLGNGGGTIGVTATAANGICLLQSGTAALAGNMTYVQQ